MPVIYYSSGKKVLLKDLQIREENFDYFEERFDLIEDVENLYYGFDSSFLGLEDKIYLYITDLIKELQSRGLDASLENNEIVIKCCVSSLNKDVSNLTVDTDRKSILDIQDARVNAIKNFRNNIKVIEDLIDKDILKNKSETIEQIMKILAFKVMSDINSNGVSFSAKALQVNYDGFVTSDYITKNNVINADYRYVKSEINRIIEDKDLYYVFFDVRALLVNLDDLLNDLRSRGLVAWRDTADLFKVSADIPSKEEILRRELRK